MTLLNLDLSIVLGLEKLLNKICYGGENDLINLTENGSLPVLVIGLKLGVLDNIVTP